MQQQCSQFDPGLPTARKFLDGAVEIFTFDLEAARDFPATPIGLVAVTHQKIQRRLPWFKRIMLPQVANSQRRVMNDFAFLQLFGPQQGS